MFRDSVDAPGGDAGAAEQEREQQARELSAWLSLMLQMCLGGLSTICTNRKRHSYVQLL